MSAIGKTSDVYDIRDSIKENMTKNGAHIRSLEACRRGINFCRKNMKDVFGSTKISDLREYSEVFINMDILISQFVYLNAIKEYILKGGRSRGSYLINDDMGKLPVEGLTERFRFSLDKDNLSDVVCEIELKGYYDGLECDAKWKNVRPIPITYNWFENVWNDYINDRIIK